MEIMFSEKLGTFIKEADKIGRLPVVAKKDVLALLETCGRGEGLEIEGLLTLINSTSDHENRRLILDFSAEYRRPHDREILLLPPLYISSICENDCLYCDFSPSGARLSYNDFEREFDALLELGYRSIELVSAQDTDLFLRSGSFDLNHQSFRIDPVIEYFNIAKKKLTGQGGGMLTINFPPVDYESFKKMKTSGLDCYLVWLETFNPEQYLRLHYDEGPKINQAFRLNSFEEAAKAGIEHLAGAFLKGLYDWRKEEVVLYLLDRYLKTKNGRGFSIIGTPRLKGNFLKSRLVSPYRVSDKDYELNTALDRILYDGILWLQTRESYEMNRRLITKYGGGVILTLTSCTAPGGYHSPPRGAAQFPVYKQDLQRSVSDLEEKGFRVHFDWNSRSLFEFQRKGAGAGETAVFSR
jgi:2-iminoacetate synthase ThiH